MGTSPPDTLPPSSEAVRLSGGPTDVEGPEALALRLAELMAARWHQGERPPAEEFLNTHPELWHQPRAAAGLIYEEYCLRQQYGEPQSSAEVLRRFPQWQAQLQVLLRCHHVLEPAPARPRFPEAGEAFGEFHLLAELGRGALGRVFLATQPSLSGRPVVLKLTPRTGREHLSLARLQHTHVVPLYWVHEDPARDLRVLCMPYFGGTTLAQLLAALSDTPVARRTGRQVIEALDRTQAAAPVPCTARGTARPRLAGATYVEAVCWIGACLADALQYAHERGLLHLDLKPSNVLLAADGQPMLLDFHLAREPIEPGRPVPGWVGGTLGYMPPEQKAALIAVRHERPIVTAVDGRADVFSLGVLLHEALSGHTPEDGEPPPPLRPLNDAVTPGLADLIGKCLAPDPAERYPDAAAVAADLRRHLGDLPLRGAPNRSWVERWHKWRRRRPQGLTLAAVLAVAGAVLVLAAAHVQQQLADARAALRRGQTHVRDRRYPAAIDALQQGLAVVRPIPFTDDLKRELQNQLAQVEEMQRERERRRLARELHELADHLRFVYGVDALPAVEGARLERRCGAVWDQRRRILDALGDEPGSAVPASVRTDLLDLAILWADLRVGLARGDQAALQQGLRVLAQAEELFGHSAVLDCERQNYAVALGKAGAGIVPAPARTAWEHYAVGRTLLRSADLPPLPPGDGVYALGQALLRSARLGLAAAEFERARVLQPGALWPNFYQGVCAYRLGRYRDAADAFGVCIGAAPHSAACFYNRALAYHGDRRFARAVNDLRQALDLGADPAAANYQMSLAHLAQGDRAAALASLRECLRHDPGHRHAQVLLDRWQAAP